MRQARRALMVFFLWRTLAVAGLASVTVGCVSEPITGRTLWAGGLISEAQANEMGVQAYQEMLGEANLSGDAESSAMVERLKCGAHRMREPCSW